MSRGALWRLFYKASLGDHAYKFLFDPGPGDEVVALDCETTGLDPRHDDIVAIGSGGSYALAAARALKHHSTLSAPEIVRQALMIAGEICIYTNTNITVLELDGPAPAPGA